MALNGKLALPPILFFSFYLSTSCRHPDTNVGAYEASEVATSFDSTVDGLSMRGTHVVIKDGRQIRVIRSQTPRKDTDFQELKTFKLTDVLIFKNQISTEVDTEIEHLHEIGIKSSNILHIEFPYHGFAGDFTKPCNQTVQALKFINAMRQKKDRKLLFHCTMGEDRTGYLAGLVDLLETDEAVMDVFSHEMCANGYSAGNPHKPRSITALIDNELTPVFLRMAYLIHAGKLSWSKLNPAVCQSDPGEEADFQSNADFSEVKQYRCKE